MFLESRRVIKWNVPAEYQRFKARAELTKARRVLPRAFLRAGVPTYLLSVVFLLWLRARLPAEVQKDIARAIWVMAVCIVIFFASLVLALYLNQYETVRVWLKRSGVVHHSKGWSWKQVTWYRFRDIDDFPHLRMLELGIVGRRGRERLLELAFDPSNTDEQAMAELVAEVLPGKERLNW